MATAICSLTSNIRESRAVARFFVTGERGGGRIIASAESMNLVLDGLLAL